MQDVQTLLKDFYKITGARVSLHSSDFTEIAAYPPNISPFCTAVQKHKEIKEKCLRVDCLAFLEVKKSGKPYKYKCHMGLVEIVAPIYHYGILSGYVMMGQISDNIGYSYDEILGLSKNYFDNLTELKKLISAIPKADNAMLSSYFNILDVLAHYLTASNAVRPNKDDLASSVKNFLDLNFSSNLSIEKLCDRFNCSRATLMKSFKQKYDITVFNYINEIRLASAAEKLKATNLAIKEIAINSGYQDQNYFSKAFIKRYNKTPSEYRKAE